MEISILKINVFLKIWDVPTALPQHFSVQIPIYLSCTHSSLLPPYNHFYLQGKVAAFRQRRKLRKMVRWDYFPYFRLKIDMIYLKKDQGS